MATQMINLADLRRPKNYLRGRVNAEYVRQKESEAREVMTTADDRKTLHAARWPFPALVVRRVEEAAAKEGGKPTVFFEIIDGVNRREVAQSLYPKGDFALPCIVKTYASDAEAFADQIKLNNDNRGLYLDRTARNNGIIMLRDTYKMPVRRIATLTGVSHASVVRIKKGKQGTGETGRRAVAARKRHAAARQGRKVTRKRATSKAPTWSAKMFIRQCEQLSREFEDHQPDIAETVKKAGDRSYKVGRPFASFITSLAG